MAFTDEQQAFWDWLGVGATKPSGEQTLAQARSVRAWSFRHACALEGVPLPTEEEVIEHLEAHDGAR